jgi:hypothetical protein
VPAGHGVGLLLAAAQYEPAGHASHSLAAVRLERALYVPAAQAKRVVELLPAGQ